MTFAMQIETMSIAMVVMALLMRDEIHAGDDDGCDVQLVNVGIVVGSDIVIIFVYEYDDDLNEINIKLSLRWYFVEAATTSVSFD